MLKKINKRVILYMLIAVCMISLYFYTARPASLHYLLDNKSPVSGVDIDTLFIKQESSSLPRRIGISLDNKQDVDAIMSILNNYKYSEVPRFYTLRHILRTDSVQLNGQVIKLSFYYKNSSNKLVFRIMEIDSDNTVTISNKKSDINIRYKIVNDDKNLFNRLLVWISNNWRDKKQLIKQ